MNAKGQLCVRLFHCGNRNITNPGDRLEKNIFYMPMGIFAIADSLEKNGFDVEIVHIDLETAENIKEILDFNTLDVVGLDCHWINQGLVVLNIAELIKKANPDVFIVLGGFSASFFAGEILRDYPFVDAVIRGDSEVPLVELCSVLHQSLPGRMEPGQGFETVRNLAWRRANGDIRLQDISYTAAAADLDSLDFARMDLLRNWESYRDLCRFWTSFEVLNRQPLFLLEVGRGCIYNCSFCGGNARAQHCINNRSYQAVRSIDAVISTIEKAVSLGYSLFYTCFNFPGCDKWYIQLFQRIKQKRLKISFVYGCWGIPSKMLMDTISDACDQVIFELSPETANPHLRKKNKDPRLFYSNRQLEECMDYMLTKPNIKLQLYFGYFLPFDTEDTILETMTYITKLFSRYSQLGEFTYSNFSTDPGSLLYFQPHHYQVDIKVRCFKDYLNHIEEIYIKKREIPFAEMTLYRPIPISELQAVDITNKVDLFNKLISVFRDSIYLMVNHTGKYDILTTYLRDIHLVEKPVKEFTPGKLKDLLLDLCSDYDIRDTDILNCIQKEFLETTPDNDKDREITGEKPGETGKMVIITEEEKYEISSTIQQAQENIQMEFDI
jgi:radical SAM superfamily enzyme YgiQ (UPF0313 family)